MKSVVYFLCLTCVLAMGCAHLYLEPEPELVTLQEITVTTPAAIPASDCPTDPRVDRRLDEIFKMLQEHEMFLLNLERGFFYGYQRRP